MSIGVLHGQNGGTGLAVKVVGGTQKPSNAKQGVIWVNTDLKITGWTMQVEEPTEPTEGMVWIAILTPARLNALKKNGIWFMPASAKQYSDGGWVKKTGEYYNNDQWVALFEATIHITYPAGSTCRVTDGKTTLTAPDTSGTWDCVVPNAGDWVVSLDSGLCETVAVTTDGEVYTLNSWPLYKNGKTNDSVTGGWKTAGWAQPSSHEAAQAPSVTYNTDSVTLTVSNTDSTNMRGGVFEPKNQINLTGINKLRLKVVSIYYGATEHTDIQFGVFNRASSTYATIAISRVPLSSTTSNVYIDVDVSSLSGNKYICVYLRSRNQRTVKVTFSEILLVC